MKSLAAGVPTQSPVFRALAMAAIIILPFELALLQRFSSY
jgi:hypothetical protein